jgi:ABC-type glycerol-3-phosphate transport system permease component
MKLVEFHLQLTIIIYPLVYLSTKFVASSETAAVESRVHRRFGGFDRQRHHTNVLIVSVNLLMVFIYLSGHFISGMMAGSRKE